MLQIYPFLPKNCNLVQNYARMRALLRENFTTFVKLWIILLFQHASTVPQPLRRL